MGLYGCDGVYVLTTNNNTQGNKIKETQIICAQGMIVWTGNFPKNDQCVHRHRRGKEGLRIDTTSSEYPRGLGYEILLNIQIGLFSLRNLLVSTILTDVIHVDKSKIQLRTYSYNYSEDSKQLQSMC